MKRFSFFHVKYISLAEQAAAPEQGAAVRLSKKSAVRQTFSNKCSKIGQG